MIERDEAIEIARKRAEQNGCAFVEQLGCRARFAIDAANDGVMEEGCIPR